MPSSPEESEKTIAARLRENWFRSIWELSNLNLQQRTWLNPQNCGPHWSYVEFAETYPGEDQLADARSRGWLTLREFALLQELERKLFNYFAPNGDDYRNAAVVVDPAWHAIITAAQRTRDELLAIVNLPSERETLHAGTLSIA